MKHTRKENGPNVDHGDNAQSNGVPPVKTSVGIDNVAAVENIFADAR